ncbi:hypothetical protein GCM10011607_11790 [Shewanella inventionis]|uniref:Uncharacterized protein n=1 Tax=Shewanella inventionis TaxID=1738770 RepID=A0ABQ1IV75_9GAMM|nr:hypothetical protein [Shewanella inventionis]GGB52934.1 hypothetical protein GCM10011607_11790 [Shewanella inventionis]
MSQIKLRRKQKNASVINGLYAYFKQSHLVILAKITNREKVLGLLFGRLRYCRYLFDEPISKENYIKNWYLTRRSLDSLIVMITTANPGKYAFQLLENIIWLYSSTEKNLAAELNEKELADEWLLMKGALSELLLLEPDNASQIAKEHLRNIKANEKAYFQVQYIKLF